MKITNISVLALLVAFAQGGRADDGVVRDFYVRATKYHRTDNGCDPWTKRGQTSTQLRLPQSDSVVLDQNRIGNVALDPKKVPEGSLVFETQTKRLFVATTGGRAVIRRDAAKRLANGCEQKKNALVFDFYFPREVVNTHFTECWVIPHTGKAFRLLSRTQQQQRLQPEFWLSHLLALYDKASNEGEKHQIREMIFRLQQMSKIKLG